MLRLADKLRGLSPEIDRHVRGFRACGSKQRFKSEGAADAALRSLVKRGLDRPEQGNLHTYHCHRCGGFHVGHQRV